jgi:hypothetical protein
MANHKSTAISAHAIPREDAIFYLRAAQKLQDHLHKNAIKMASTRRRWRNSAIAGRRLEERR